MSNIRNWGDTRFLLTTTLSDCDTVKALQDMGGKLVEKRIRSAKNEWVFEKSAQTAVTKFIERQLVERQLVERQLVERQLELAEKVPSDTLEMCVLKMMERYARPPTVAWISQSQQSCLWHYGAANEHSMGDPGYRKYADATNA